MQFTVYSNTGKSAVYPLLLDVTSDIIGQLNRRIVIPLLPGYFSTGSSGIT
uniref:CcdB family protein n=1 Tax=Escherichia coli TaxID=562 RepID=UPI001BD41809